MAQSLQSDRESWGTRGGFVLAAVGSAVGLGNLWAFPYKLYGYGGGAFLIPYIIAMLLIGIPLLILETSLGHYTQSAAPEAFRRGHKRFEIVGWWGILLGFVIVTYYPVILAYCFSFLGYSISGIFNGGELPWSGEGLEGVEKAKRFFFDEYLGRSSGYALGSIRWNIVGPLLVAWCTMYLCVCRGVKLVGKIVWFTVPLPWLMLFILAVRGLTLEGSMQGLAYYLDPVWSQLARPATWRYAFGQVFFSLSLAFGVMITYASFLHRKSDINNNACIIGLADFATSFVAGLAVFATLGAMAFATQQANAAVGVEKVVEKGPSLAFVAFPYALAQLPYAAYFSFIFFFALVTLGVDSAFSITESVVASIVDKTGWPRWAVLVVVSATGLVFGVVFVTEGGINWLEVVDGFVNGTWGIAFLGLLECVVLGWLWRIENLRRHANSRSDFKIGKWWDYLVRLVIPVVLGTLFFWQLFDDFQSKEGFLRAADGDWIFSNCVGMGIVIVVPVVAIIFSLARSVWGGEDRQGEFQYLSVGGRAGGLTALVISFLPQPLALWCLFDSTGTVLEHISYALLLMCGLAGVFLAAFLLDRHNTSTTQVSWFARWAGIVAIADISAAAASWLDKMGGQVDEQSGQAGIVHELSGISYIILAVVVLIVVAGLGWCFYRALLAAGAFESGIQHSDEIGDE